MTTSCEPSVMVPDFGQAVQSKGATGKLAAMADGDPPTCSTSLTGTNATQCAAFTTWTQYTAAFCGVLATGASLVEQYVTDTKTATAIYNGLKAIYVGVQGVNLQFMAAITDINANTPYAPIVTPSTIPPFPVPSNGNNIGQAIESAWQILEPFLNQMMAKMAPGSYWVKVLDGLINSSKNIIDSLKALFNGLSGGK